MRRALTSLGQTRVNLIDALFEQLTALNKEITEAIENIEIQNAKRDGTYGLYGEHIEENLSISEFSKPPLLMVDVDESNTQRTQDMGIIIDTEPSPLGSPEDTPDLSSSLFSTALRNARRSSKLIVNKANQGTKLVTTLVTQEDGEPYSAGFVVFKSLRSAQAALQMTQYPEPFAMEVLEAPQPEGKFLQARLNCLLIFSFNMCSVKSHACVSPLARCVLAKRWKNSQGTSIRKAIQFWFDYHSMSTLDYPHGNDHGIVNDRGAQRTSSVHCRHAGKSPLA